MSTGISFDFATSVDWPLNRVYLFRVSCCNVTKPKDLVVICTHPGFSELMPSFCYMKTSLAKSRGFTLVELIVATTLMLVLTRTGLIYASAGS
jgi:prepilin-type N-terminal cleavage/methylation domain-containing protein